MSLDAELAALTRVAEADPGDADAARRLATLLLRAGRRDDARAWALRAARAAPGPTALAHLRACEVPLALLPADGDARLPATSASPPTPVGHALVAAAGGLAALAAPLPYARSARPWLDVELACGVGLDGEGRVAVWAHALADLAPLPGAPFALPPGAEPRALARLGPALYVGCAAGRERRECLLVRNITQPDAPWREVALPAEAPPAVEGKAVDALVVDGARLIAVDDIVFPKFLFRYDVRDPLAPAPVSVHEIPTHYTYEHVIAASLARGWLVLLSGGAGRGGALSVVSFFDRDALVERCCLSAHFSHRRGARESWQDVLAVGDRLFVATGSGVSALDLARSADPHREAEPRGEAVFVAGPQVSLEDLTPLPLDLARGELVYRLARCGPALLAAIAPVHPTRDGPAVGWRHAVVART